MKTGTKPNHAPRKQSRYWPVLTGLLLVADLVSLHAQLAITEVMSSASTNLGSTYVTQRSDFWELTNFGTNTVDLSDGYWWNDEGGIDGADSSVFFGLTIDPDESIIFFQQTDGACTNADQFRAWWGPSNLPNGLKIVPYTGNGFASGGADAVQLWHVVGAATNLVHRVELYKARQGFTFTYNPATGEFDQFSAIGQSHVFKAEQADDVGSPGWTIGPVPIAISQQPQALDVDVGSPASFSVRATGLPRPRFQWRKNGTDIVGATSSKFTIPATLTNDAGTFTVEVSNGVESRLSTPAALQVNATPSPARIVVPPADLSVTTNQTALFTVGARGYPLPTFQWQSNGVVMPGATNATLSIIKAGYASAGTYCVRVQNPLGTTNACGVLTVHRKPNLVVTEMMGAPSTNTTRLGHGDWWELTNPDTNAVDVTGYRFDDFPGVLEGAVRITNAFVKVPGAIYVTNHVIIQPGESILFLSDMTPEAFACWWGEGNLPERIQFVCYTGNGFQAEGDTITLWNSTATDPEDFITRGEYVNLNDDFTPRRGVSLTFWCTGWIEFGQPSVQDQCGAVVAMEGGDVGSPGFVSNHSPHSVVPRAPRCLRVTRDGQGVHLTWSTQCDKTYELWCKDDLAATNWTSVITRIPAAGPQTITTDASAAGRPHRFYRLSVLPDLP